MKGTIILLALILIGGAVIGYLSGGMSGSNFYNTGAGDKNITFTFPTVEKYSKWGPLPLGGMHNDYANIVSAVYWWNETGAYITIRIKVDKPAYLEGIYTADSWMGINSLPLDDYKMIKKLRFSRNAT